MNDLIELGETIKRRNLDMALKRNPTAAAEIDRLKARIAELEAQLAAAQLVGGAVPCAPSCAPSSQTKATPKAKRSAK